MEVNVVSLDSFKNGELLSKFNNEYQRILNNIDDPNTDIKKARKISLTLTFDPYEDRNGANIKVDAKSTLAPAKSIQTRIIFERDIETGKMVSSEIGNKIPGQVEVEEVIEAQNDGTIIDLQKKAK